MKFNILEKKALIGITLMGTLFFASIVYVGQRNLWFEPKVKFNTHIQDADGLREGAVVTLAGLRVGEVTDLQVAKDNKIEVTFTVKKSLAERVTKNSVAKLHRTFLIGEKRIDLIPAEGEPLPAGSNVKGMDSTELADMLSGKNMNSIFARLSDLQKGLDNWAKSFNALSENIKPEEIVGIYKLITPTLHSVKKLADEMMEVTALSSEIRRDFIKNSLAKKTLGHVEKTLMPLASREKLLEDALDSVSLLTTELAKYPHFAKDLVETLKETSTTLKAIQRTWMLKDHVEDVKKDGKNK